LQSFNAPPEAPAERSDAGASGWALNDDPDTAGLKHSKKGTRFMTHLKMLCSGLLVVLITAPTYAQGLLVPHHHHHHWPLPRPIVRPRPIPPTSYKIKEISINARIQDQVARTQVTQSFVNTGSRQIEVSFVFPLPYDGAIDRLTFMVDGKEYDAKLMTKEEARRIYEGYVRRNKDPALLEWVPVYLRPAYFQSRRDRSVRSRCDIRSCYGKMRT
jgi:hypothetical protein